jgi:hypothetical protein
MKRTYEKPFIDSERVFGLASQACDLNHDCPGICQNNAMYASCYPFDYKHKYEFCGPVPNPRADS